MLSDTCNNIWIISVEKKKLFITVILTQLFTSCHICIIPNKGARFQPTWRGRGGSVFVCVQSLTGPCCSPLRSCPERPGPQVVLCRGMRSEVRNGVCLCSSRYARSSRWAELVAVIWQRERKNSKTKKRMIPLPSSPDTRQTLKGGEWFTAVCRG